MYHGQAAPDCAGTSFSFLTMILSLMLFYFKVAYVHTSGSERLPLLLLSSTSDVTCTLRIAFLYLRAVSCSCFFDHQFDFMRVLLLTDMRIHVFIIHLLPLAVFYIILLLHSGVL